MRPDRLREDEEDDESEGAPVAAGLGVRGGGGCEQSDGVSALRRRISSQNEEEAPERAEAVVDERDRDGRDARRDPREEGEDGDEEAVAAEDEEERTEAGEGEFTEGIWRARRTLASPAAHDREADARERLPQRGEGDLDVGVAARGTVDRGCITGLEVVLSN